MNKDVRGALAAGLDAVLLDRHDAHAGVDVKRIRSLDELAFGAARGCCARPPPVISDGEIPVPRT